MLLPTESRADGINTEFVAIAGVAILVPLTLFTILVEGFVLAMGFRVPYRRTLLVMLTANCASLAAGIPVKIFNAWMYARILPRPLAPYFRLYPYAVCLGSAVFFVVTLITEYAVIAAWLRRKRIEIRRRRLATVVLIANTITYAVLAPLHYFATRPTNDVREFTDGAAWAEKPATELLYISGNGNLCSVTTDGNNRRVRVPDIVRDYQYVPSQGTYLYRDGSNNLCLFRESDRTRIQCVSTGERFLMEQVACRPDGGIVAHLSRVGQLKPYELVLFDSRSGRTVKTGFMTDMDEYDPEIAWAEDPSKLFLLSGRMVRPVVIAGDLTAAAEAPNASNGPLAKVYGRFSTGHWWGGNYLGASLSHDTNKIVQAYAIPGLGSHLSITHNNETFIVADNPGLLRLGNRGFNEVCLLGNGKELVFDDHHDIYLVNIAQRKVGRIVDGSQFITVSPRYQRQMKKANSGIEPIR